MLNNENNNLQADSAEEGGKGKNVFRAIVGLGLGLMIVSYVVSVKSDLFKAQIVDDITSGAMTEEIALKSAASDTVTTEVAIMDAVEDVMTSELLFAAAADVMTSEDEILEEVAIADDVATGEEVYAAASDVMTGEDSMIGSADSSTEDSISDDFFAEDEVAVEEPIAEDEVAVAEEEVITAPIFDDKEVDDIIFEAADPVAVVTEPEVMEPEVTEPVVIEEVAVVEDELMEAPAAQEKLVDTGLNAYLLALLTALVAWSSVLVFKKEEIGQR